jgi:hypothetical protein
MILANASPLATPASDNIRISDSLKADVESRRLQAREGIGKGDIEAANKTSVRGIVGILLQ